MTNWDVTRAALAPVIVTITADAALVALFFVVGPCGSGTSSPERILLAMATVAAASAMVVAIAAGRNVSARWFGSALLALTVLTVVCILLTWSQTGSTAGCTTD